MDTIDQIKQLINDRRDAHTLLNKRKDEMNQVIGQLRTDIKDIETDIEEAMKDLTAENLQNDPQLAAQLLDIDPETLVKRLHQRTRGFIPMGMLDDHRPEITLWLNPTETTTNAQIIERAIQVLRQWDPILATAHRLGNDPHLELRIEIKKSYGSHTCLAVLGAAIFDEYGWSWGEMRFGNDVAAVIAMLQAIKLD